MTTPRIINLWPDGSSHNGDDPATRPRLVLYPTTKVADKPSPMIIVCPGGAYRMQADHEGAPFAELFAANGIASAVLFYRVAPDVHPAPIADACRAMRLIRSMADELHIDPARVGMLGFSAGGHLASTVATQPHLHDEASDDLVDTIDPRPNLLLMGYPVISFVNHLHVSCMQNLFGKSVDPTMRSALSNELHVTKDNPSTFIFHTSDDPGVPVQHSLTFAAALRDHNVDVEMHAFAHGRHGLGLAADDPKLKIWPELMLAWLDDWTGCR